MRNQFLDVAGAAAIIKSGRPMLVAGAEEVLNQLPRGSWIGGTSSYFLTDAGGMADQSRIFCTEIEPALETRIATYPVDGLTALTQDRFAHGYSSLLIPAFSQAHTSFALDAAGYADIFAQPLVGWIAGIHLDDLNRKKPKVYNGGTGEVLEDAAVALHVQLPDQAMAHVDIVNLFEQGSGDRIVFPTKGFEASECLVNGERMNFARYCQTTEVDTRLPLVANYAGAMINVSLQNVDPDAGRVSFYAPVVDGVEYRLARPVDDYVAAFSELAGKGGGEAFSCNCVLNYLYAELEGRHTGAFTGPATFGEIAYMLLNQTMVHLTIKDATRS